MNRSERWKFEEKRSPFAFSVRVLICELKLWCLQWPIGASRYRLCPCPRERRTRKVGRSASTHRCHSSSSRRPADVEILDDGVDFERSEITYPNGSHIAADDGTLAEAGVHLSSTIS